MSEQEALEHCRIMTIHRADEIYDECVVHHSPGRLCEVGASSLREALLALQQDNERLQKGWTETQRQWEHEAAKHQALKDTLGKRKDWSALGRRAIQAEQKVAEYRAALEEIGKQPCEASAYHDIEEDGVSRCIDPEYIEMGDLDPEWFQRPDKGASLLTLCNPCLARRVLDIQPKETE